MAIDLFCMQNSFDRFTITLFWWLVLFARKSERIQWPIVPRAIDWAQRVRLKTGTGLRAWSASTATAAPLSGQERERERERELVWGSQIEGRPPADERITNTLALSTHRQRATHSCAFDPSTSTSVKYKKMSSPQITRCLNKGSTFLICAQHK
jgi:hypothetical protein